MLKRLVMAVVLTATFALIVAPAKAMCTTGYIEFKNGRIVIVPPQCDPYP